MLQLHLSDQVFSLLSRIYIRDLTVIMTIAEPEIMLNFCMPQWFNISIQENNIMAFYNRTALKIYLQQLQRRIKLYNMRYETGVKRMPILTPPEQHFMQPTLLTTHNALIQFSPGALAQKSCQPGKNVESWNFKASYLDAHLKPWCKVPKNPSGGNIFI